jgi:hypothetical protein
MVVTVVKIESRSFSFYDHYDHMESRLKFIKYSHFHAEVGNSKFIHSESCCKKGVR